MSYLSAARNTCELFDIGDDGSERVAVVGVAVQRLGMQHELPASGRGDRRGNRDLAAEFVRRPRLATADALDLRRAASTATRAIAATTIPTVSRSGSAARSAVSPKPSAARCDAEPPSSP